MNDAIHVTALHDMDGFTNILELAGEKLAANRACEGERSCCKQSNAGRLGYRRRTGIAFIGLDDELVFGVVNIVGELEGSKQKRG